MMRDFNQHKSNLNQKGFSIIENIFDNVELNKIIEFIKDNNFDFSERQLLNRYPEVEEMIFQNGKFKELYNSICDNSYFLSKAIYFNKPSKSNWFVSYHQDLSISVKNREESKGFTSWTNKNKQLGVIPPIEILENIITFRIHLDKADNTNGGLKVISNSHKEGIIRIDENFNKSDLGKEILCEVEKGGVMLMKPLLLHSSSKSIFENDRRVIHLEFCNQEIPMKWLEKRKVS